MFSYCYVHVSHYYCLQQQHIFRAAPNWNRSLSPRQEDYWLGPRMHYKYCHSAHTAAHSCTPGATNTHPYAAHDSPNHVFTLIKLIILQTNQSIESSMKWKDCAQVSIHSDDITLCSPIIKQHVGRHSGEIIPAFHSCFLIVSHPTTRT